MLRVMASIALYTLLSGSALAASAVVVYDDTSKNGFDPNCSFFVTPNFASTSPVHSGSASISFAPSQFGAVSWCTPVTESTSAYSGLSFWVNGGAGGGQDLEVAFLALGSVQAEAPIAALLGHSIAANSWAQVTASLDAPPLQYAGNFDQLVIQDNSGNPAGSPQPTVYFDDVILLGRQADGIFTNSFEAPAGPYNVSATVSGGNGTIAPGTQSVAVGSTATFTVTPSPGYHVASVTGDHCSAAQQGAGTTWVSNAITQNCAVTATFTINQYTVTSSAPGGYGTITPASQPVNSGTTASFTVTPNANYHVASVAGDTCTVTQAVGNSWSSDAITQNCVVTASFASDALLPPTCGMNDEHDVTVDGMLSDNFTWCDASGQPRSATLAHNNDPAGPGGSRGGDLREFRYETAGGTRIVSAPHRDHGGFGYIVSHSLTSIPNCDDSYLGHLITGTWTRVFEGRHHAIFRFQQNYPRYCTLNGPTTNYNVPVTIDWIFSTGRDNPTWAVTYDIAGSGVSADILADDSRAPYGTLNIDGSLNGDGSPALYMDNDIGGVSWGDRYIYATTSSPAAPNSSWTWTAANDVPFVDLWSVGADAAMGLVQTQTMNQQDAGGGRQPYGPGTYDVSSYWTKTSANGQACPNGADDQQLGVAHSVPCLGLWPYQLISFNYYEPANLSQSTNDAQMTWGTQYGFLGQSAYALHDSTLPANSTASGYPKKSYSVYVVLGPHSSAPVTAQRAEIEAMQTVTFGVTVGSVATSGPAGVNRADTITYDPPGYDHIYGALAFIAASNTLDANVAVGSGTLHNPLIIVRNYTNGNYPTTVKLNGTTLAIDVDYFPSLRGAASELWITLNRDLTGATNHLQMTP